MSRRDRPAKPALSQAAIVDAALVLLDSDGLDGVSMRRVAQALDTGPASLYVYVHNRDELVSLLVDRVAGEVSLPIVGPESDWREQLIDLMKTDYFRLLTEPEAGYAMDAPGTIVEPGELFPWAEKKAV